MWVDKSQEHLPHKGEKSRGDCRNQRPTLSKGQRSNFVNNIVVPPQRIVLCCLQGGINVFYHVGSLVSV